MTALMLNADTDLRQVGWLTPKGSFVSMEVHPPAIPDVDACLRHRLRNEVRACLRLPPQESQMAKVCQHAP